MLIMDDFNTKELEKERIKLMHDYMRWNLRITNTEKFMKSYLKLKDLFYESELFE
jgi:hypothetical protein